MRIFPAGRAGVSIGIGAFFLVILGVVLQVLFSAPMFNENKEWGSIIVNLATLLPGLTVSVRRLHDIDKSGWWLLIMFTFIGIIPLTYWACKKGSTGQNRFGADPLAAPRPAKCDNAHCGKI